MLAVEGLGLLALGHQRADAGLGEEGRDAGAAGADALGQRALRVELQLQLAGEVELGEELVLADVGGDHLLDLAGLEQQAEAEAVDAGIVGDAGQVLHAGLAQRRDQVLRNAEQPEAAGHHRHAVEQHARRAPIRILIDLVRHVPSWLPPQTQLRRCRRHTAAEGAWATAVAAIPVLDRYLGRHIYGYMITIANSRAEKAARRLAKTLDTTISEAVAVACERLLEENDQAVQARRRAQLDRALAEIWKRHKLPQDEAERASMADHGTLCGTDGSASVAGIAIDTSALVATSHAGTASGPGAGGYRSCGDGLRHAGGACRGRVRPDRAIWLEPRRIRSRLERAGGLSDVVVDPPLASLAVDGF